MKVTIGDVELWDMQEIADAFGLNIETVRVQVREGRLKARKVGRKYYSTVKEVNDWVFYDSKIPPTPDTKSEKGDSRT